MVNILIIGSGGREHALAWAVRRSGSAGSLYIAPGNPGTAPLGENVALNASDHEAVAAFCRANGIDLVVIGPENPLADGIAGSLRARDIAVFGPGKEGALLESSKSYGKSFMQRHGIPLGGYRSFTALSDASSHVRNTGGPWVIKTDGLALGKGVTITGDRREAAEVLESFFSGKAHGDAGRKVVIEDFLCGKELTAMALTDGNTVFALPFARDHKRVFDDDMGPNTGGMGAYSPVPLTGYEERAVIDDVLGRTLSGLKADGIGYRGTIFAGLMLTKDGPKVLEYNVRFGDPETECVLPRLKGDIAGLLLACAGGRLAPFLKENPVTVLDDACVCVIMASGGYPGPYRKGLPILGLSLASGPEWDGDPPVFHAGTKEENGRIVTGGGRVLAVSAMGATLEEAGKRAYARVSKLGFEGANYRKDIMDDAE